MNRVVLAVLAVVVAVAVIVLIARQGGGEINVDRVRDAAPEAAPAEEPYDAAGDVVLEVRELLLGDGATNQQSIRVEHPDPAVQKKVRDWLDARETAAVATGASLDCHAQTAKTSFISITCASLEPELDAGTDASPMPSWGRTADALTDAAGATADASSPDAATRAKPTVKYESLTIRVIRGRIKELALADVLVADAGEAEVIAACKKSAEPPLPCVWPPTTFAVSPGGTLFLCHDSYCVDIDSDAEILRPELR